MTSAQQGGDRELWAPQGDLPRGVFPRGGMAEDVRGGRDTWGVQRPRAGGRCASGVAGDPPKVCVTAQSQAGPWVRGLGPATQARSEHLLLLHSFA